MNCSAIDATTGRGVEVAFDRTIASVSPSSHPGGLYIAPGWIDLWVNGRHHLQ